MAHFRSLLSLLLLHSACAVKELFTAKEFKDLLAEAGGRPIVLDFYSMSCGPCHMIAPVFRKISKEFAGKAYFRKVDVARNQQLAHQQNIRSMPTFQFWLRGKKRHQFSGADEYSLREWTQKLVQEADRDDIIVTREALEEFYQKHDPGKATKESLDNIMQKNGKDFPTMVRLLKKKYGEAPKTTQRPKPAKDEADSSSSGSGGGKAGPNLQAASLDELKHELERREEEAAEVKAEEEERRLSNNPCTLYRNRTAGAIERVVIVGGGPAGMTAAIYAARSNLCPLVIAPAIGGQLMAKGVDVENYPGLPRENGGEMIQVMKHQARSFYAEVWDDLVVSVNTSVRPFQIYTNGSGLVQAHTLIAATGANSKWLHVKGEWDYRGFGVSSCAACDGYLFKGKACAVIGGGDSAMEEALMLARICSSVTLIHRRDTFRASLVLQQRVLNHPHISVRWNTAIKRFVGQTASDGEGDERKELTHLELVDTQDSSVESQLPVDAAFIAIGHDPNTRLFKGQVDMDETGYIHVNGPTKTSVPGFFAAGDVADNVYRQAITSAGSGAMAALDAERYLSENPVEEESCVRQEDFQSWSLKDLREQVRLLGVKCVACSEKADFIASLQASF
ncbi:trxB [Symbiodinium natans]|uniref:TrxB protein n=1 Tax=Symbiodinium natans TaxID=878477 RepID=A0A812M3U0_9DINO|nr:trxB [Symbiodinium natans]